MSAAQERKKFTFSFRAVRKEAKPMYWKGKNVQEFKEVSGVRCSASRAGWLVRNSWLGE
jgi:hypothetical protein